jgi:predicted small lipoprotein YifL
MKHVFLSSAALGVVALAACGDKTPVEAATEVVKVDEVKVERTPTKTAYFGDLHIHTKNSFDAFIVGTRTTADDAYRFAQGQAIDNGAGKTIQLSGVPLDFYGVSDHGEYMGVVAAMRDKDNPISKTKTAQSIFGLMAGNREARREAFIEIGTTIVTGEEIEDIYDRDFIDSAWAENVAAAEKHNQPGKFTTFAAYEFTAMSIVGENVEDTGAINLHRNVIFKDQAPSRLFTTLDSPNPEDLWDWMNQQRESGIDVLAIPHNSNGSNGQMFDIRQRDGSDITKAYATNRMLNEPIVEISQVKGTSETHPLLSPNDEWAGHELYDVLVGTPVKSEVVSGSFVRPTLGVGLKIAKEIDANPYQFGVIGSTDAHVSASSLNEENFFGKFSSDLEIETRKSIPPNGAKTWDLNNTNEDLVTASAQYAAAGLAGVWAEANTREDLFESMQAKEVFATSGPRIRVRFFASDRFDAGILDDPNMVQKAYDTGVPMGGVLPLSDSAPDFLVWAMRDGDGAPLQRAQVVKVTAEGEQVYDAVCADGSEPEATTQRCRDNGARVDIATCKTSGAGASELKTLWQDPDWKAEQAASYYVRVLENPKCRWSTWDAVRNGTPPNPKMDSVLQDRAWSSPIWVQ